MYDGSNKSNYNAILSSLETMSLGRLGNTREVAGEREVWALLLGTLPPDPTQIGGRKWLMEAFKMTHTFNFSVARTWVNCISNCDSNLCPQFDYN